MEWRLIRLYFNVLHNKLTRILRILLTGCSQSIKIDTNISIDKSVEIISNDLIDIDCIDQSVEIDSTGIFFIDIC